MNIKNFNTFVNEAHQADVAIESLLHKVMGDDFLDFRDDILDNVYTTLGMRTINMAFEMLSNEYPELASHKDEFYEAAEKEGYTVMTADKWKSGEIE
jgi:hypothetical protein